MKILGVSALIGAIESTGFDECEVHSAMAQECDGGAELLLFHNPPFGPPVAVGRRSYMSFAEARRALGLWCEHTNTPMFAAGVAQ